MYTRHPKPVGHYLEGSWAQLLCVHDHDFVAGAMVHALARKDGTGFCLICFC